MNAQFIGVILYQSEGVVRDTPTGEALAGKEAGMQRLQFIVELLQVFSNDSTVRLNMRSETLLTKRQTLFQ